VPEFGERIISKMTALEFTTPPKSRAWLFLLLRWAAALLIVALLIHFLPMAPLREALSHIPLPRFAVLLVIYSLALTVGILKWHLVVNSADARLPFAVSAQCYAGGIFGALFLPSIVGGDVVRLTVGISHSRRPTSVVTGNLTDRIVDMGAQLALAFSGMSLLAGSAPSLILPSARRLLLIIAIAGVLLLLSLAALRPLLRGRAIRLRRRLVQVRRAIREVARHPGRLLLSWLLGICVQGTFLSITMLLGIACGLHLPLRVWLFAWPLSKMAAVLPITQGGIGVREAAMVALLVPFGAPAAQVLATGIASEGIVIAGGLLAGLSAFLLRRQGARRHRQAEPLASASQQT